MIPPLSSRGARALEIRDRLVRLSKLGIGDKVLDLYGADLDDLEMIAVIEDELSDKPREDGAQ